MSEEHPDTLVVQLSLSPDDLVALEAGTYVGDPVRRAVENAAKSDNREVQWETLHSWVNKQPHSHPGIDIRVFVKAPKKEIADE